MMISIPLKEEAMVLAYHEHYTVEDYQQWKGDWELIGGMPYAMTPSPTVTHQICAANLLHQVKSGLERASECCRCQALMETDWEVSNDTVVRPDILVTCEELAEKVVKTPVLIAEIISASSAKRDENLKFDLYQKEGVLFYLLIYPEKRLAKIYRNVSGEFVKIADVGNERLEFELGGCVFGLDFGQVWR